jgi:hypothetical protein
MDAARQGHAFGDFQLKLLRIKTGFGEGRLHAFHQPGVFKLDGGYIDLHRDFGEPLFLPCLVLAACLFQNPFPYGNNMPATFCNANKCAGRHKTLAWVVPTDQRFDAG